MMAICLVCSCTKEVQTSQPAKQTITAYIEETAITKSCITSDLEGQTEVPVLWSPDDALGVFTDAQENNIRYSNTNHKSNVEVATFASETTVSGTPEYAYYPYSTSAGTDRTALKGSVPQTQTMNTITGMIPGDYKFGVHASTTSSGSQFRFTHLFSPIRVKFDGSNTALANDRLIGIDLTVTRNGAAVPVCGDFTFNATDGSYTVGNTSNKVTFDWPGHPTMETAKHGYATIFPEIKAGDNLDFTIRTSAHTATLSVTAKVDFKPNTVYTFPLTFSNSSSNMTVTERTNVTSGAFTVATYNIDGLPNISLLGYNLNNDGPLAEGTTAISQKIADKSWDIVGFSEDFEYHSQLMSALSSTYTFGEHRGSVTIANAISAADTDGLGFATRNTSCSFALAAMVEYTSKAGDATKGANTCVKKGFRHYIVTLADGIVVDVIITHMNTYSDSGTDHINAQYAQLTQVAKYINSLTGNNRPIIFMGDTNCRYTRHDFQTYFWQYLADDQTYGDPWVDYQWDGIYPTYGPAEKSLVVSDATGTNADTDIIYSSQKGEVVDKVMYINDSGASVQIYANGYNRDADFSGMADHWPIVVEFYYEKTATGSASTQLEVYEWEDETIE